MYGGAMSLLSSYSYGLVLGRNKLPARSMGLFKNVNKLKDDMLDDVYVVYYQALKGKQFYNPEKFNISGYIYRNKRWDKIKQFNEEKKRLSIDMLGADDTKVSERNNVEMKMSEQYRQIDMYEYLEDRDEYAQILFNINIIEKRCRETYNIDFKACLSNALKGYHKATQTLTWVCQADESIVEVVEAILSFSKYKGVIDEEFAFTEKSFM
jgi:hypothetical protein